MWLVVAHIHTYHFFRSLDKAIFIKILIFSLAVFAKKTSRYCHSLGIVGDGVGGIRRCAKTLTFSNSSIITEDIYLKLRIFIHYQNGNPYLYGRYSSNFFGQSYASFST